MPVYEYKCRKCGKDFEYTQRITEDPLSFCPENVCEMEVKGEGPVERKISKNIGLVFKGSGFYLTDYAKKNSAPITTAESSPAVTDTIKDTASPATPKSNDKSDAA